MLTKISVNLPAQEALALSEEMRSSVSKSHPDIKIQHSEIRVQRSLAAALVDIVLSVDIGALSASVASGMLANFLYQKLSSKKNEEGKPIIVIIVIDKDGVTGEEN